MNRLWLLCILIPCILAGCSQSIPSLLSCDGTLVVDYAADGSVSQRLSVFAEAGSDLTRAQSLRVEHRESGLSWQIGSHDGTVMSVSGRSWFGSGYLYPPAGELVPAGRYTVSYVDLAGRSAESTFFLDMTEGFTAPSSLQSANALSSVSSLPRTPPASLSIVDGSWKLTPYSGPLTQKYVLLYTDSGTLAAMEVPEQIPSSIVLLKRRYPDAVSLRVWMEDDRGMTGILLPPVRISGDAASGF